MKAFHVALKIAILLLVLGLVSWSMCGNGKLISINFDHGIDPPKSNTGIEADSVEAPPEDPPPIDEPLAGTFTGVVVSGAVHVTIFDSPRSKVVISNTVAAGTLPSPRIVDGILLIQGGAMDLDDDKLPSVTVYSRGVSEVTHRGKGDLTANHLTGTHLSAITTGEATLYIGGEGEACHLATSGSGNISTSWLRVPRLSIAMSGSGSVEPDGEWTRLEVSQDGTGDLTVDSIRPADVFIRLTGASTADVGQVQTLRAIIQGDGKIIASGTPTTVSKEILGKGTVEVRP